MFSFVIDYTVDTIGRKRRCFKAVVQLSVHVVVVG